VAGRAGVAARARGAAPDPVQAVAVTARRAVLAAVVKVAHKGAAVGAPTGPPAMMIGVVAPGARARLVAVPVDGPRAVVWAVGRETSTTANGVAEAG